MILSRASDYRKYSIFILGHKYHIWLKEIETLFILWCFICPESDTNLIQDDGWVKLNLGVFFFFFNVAWHHEHSPEKHTKACAECGSAKNTMLGGCVKEAEVEEDDMGLERSILTSTNLTTPSIPPDSCLSLCMWGSLCDGGCRIL